MECHTTNKNVTDAHEAANKLPDDIIPIILKCLPLQDAAKVCFVSRSWYNAWKGLPELRFDAQFFAKVLKTKKPKVGDFCHILSVILLSHVGPISVFYLCVPEFESYSAPDLGPWIFYLSINDVKDITIKIMQKPPFKLSNNLFSCANLEKLTLDNCILDLLPFRKKMRNLRSIEFENVTFIRNSVAYFIASCPVLQSLTLRRCKGFDHIDITAPDLKYLVVSGKFETVYLRSAGNLIDLSITLEEIVPNYQSDKTRDLIAYLAHPCRIENLSFGGHFCKFLTAGGIGTMFSTPFHYLKSLQLLNIKTDFDECMLVIRMIRSCPRLEDLNISFSSSKALTTVIVRPGLEAQFNCLRKVHLSSVMGDNLELSLIEFLLRFSPALETMYVKRDAAITKNLESTLTQKLLYYRRASPMATVVYI